MKKLFVFILFSLIFLGGGVATAQEKNNLCPNVDLFHNIANKFTNIDLSKNPNKCNLDFKHIDINSNTDIYELYSLIKYYDNTIQFLHSLNCFDDGVVFYIENDALTPYDINLDNINKVHLEVNFINSYNFLTRYNNKILNKGVLCIE